MKHKKGILYAIKNPLWGDDIYKLGITSIHIKRRISNLNTSLYIECELSYTTDELVCCLYYEKLLKNLLIYYRINPKREFYRINKDDIKMIYNFFNEMNKILNTDEKLNEYIYKNKSISIDKPKKKKRKSIYIDTSY